MQKPVRFPRIGVGTCGKGTLLCNAALESSGGSRSDMNDVTRIVRLLSAGTIHGRYHQHTKTIMRVVEVLLDFLVRASNSPRNLKLCNFV